MALERLSGVSVAARQEVPFLVPDATTQAVGGTLELLLEKVASRNATPVGITGGKPIINFTNVFLLTAPLFVVPDVLITLCFKLFKSVSMLTATIGDVRVAVLQNRVLTILQGYAAMNAADFTRVTVERLLSFAVSVPIFAANKKHQLHPDVMKGFASLLSTTKAIAVRGDEGGAAAGVGNQRGGYLMNDTGSGAPPAVSIKSARTWSATHASPNKTIPPPTMSGTIPITSLLDMDDVELCRQVCYSVSVCFSKFGFERY